MYESSNLARASSWGFSNLFAVCPSVRKLYVFLLALGLCLGDNGGKEDERGNGWPPAYTARLETLWLWASCCWSRELFDCQSSSSAGGGPYRYDDVMALFLLNTISSRLFAGGWMWLRNVRISLQELYPRKMVLVFSYFRLSSSISRFFIFYGSRFLVSSFPRFFYFLAFSFSLFHAFSSFRLHDYSFSSLFILSPTHLLVVLSSHLLVCISSCIIYFSFSIFWSFHLLVFFTSRVCFFRLLVSLPTHFCFF